MQELETVSFETPLQKKILGFLREKGPCTRGQLCRELGKARTTIYDSLAKLMYKRLVVRFPAKDQPTRGRPIILFASVC